MKKQLQILRKEHKPLEAIKLLVTIVVITTWVLMIEIMILLEQPSKLKQNKKLDHQKGKLIQLKIDHHQREKLGAQGCKMSE